MTYHWENHNPYDQKKKRKAPIRRDDEVNNRIVKMYPDNDGGLWYYHPETGKVVRI